MDDERFLRNVLIGCILITLFGISSQIRTISREISFSTSIAICVKAAEIGVAHSECDKLIKDSRP